MTLRLMLVGDLVLDEPKADFFFDLSRGALAQADILRPRPRPRLNP